MNFEISRVYREIIEEVTRSLHSDQEHHQISPKDIADLKAVWSRKLREMTAPMERYNFRAIQESETIMPSNYSQLKNDHKREVVNFYDDLNEFDSSERDSDERLEALHPNYMMCLYVKVDKNKHKWKVKLKQGFLNIGKSEFVFDNAHGDLTW